MDLSQADILRITEFARAATKAPDLDSVISQAFRTLKAIADTDRVRIVYAPAPAHWTEWKVGRDGMEVRPHEEWPSPEKRATTVFFDRENERSGFISAAGMKTKVRFALEVLAPVLWSALTLHAALARTQSAAISEGELVRATFRARDEERRRIARELHDDLGQSLTSVKLGLKWTEDLLLKKQDIDATAAELQKMRQDVGGMLERVRDMSHTLYPRILDSLGLVAAIRDLAHQVSRRSQITIECVARGRARLLGKDIEVGLYRCCQEAINNAARHSAASKLKVAIRFAEKEVRISVEDDGKGFDPRALYDSNLRMMSSGFWTIRQRMADLEAAFRVSTAEGEGTVVEMIVPYLSGKAS